MAKGFTRGTGGRVVKASHEVLKPLSVGLFSSAWLYHTAHGCGDKVTAVRLSQSIFGAGPCCECTSTASRI